MRVLPINDGYREVRSVALLLFTKYDVHGVVFVPVGWVDRALNTMGRAGLRILKQNAIEIQPHPWNIHRRIPKAVGTMVAVV